jgi:hypothetical protein
MTASAPAPCRCGCSDAAGSHVHRIVAALDRDDLDAAIDAGLLDGDVCAGCSPACRAVLHDARESRRAALAARDRFRGRQARLARRQLERSLRREAATPQPGAMSPSLPPAAAAALARARAKAAGSSGT